jgi:hypothetical protein
MGVRVFNRGTMGSRVDKENGRTNGKWLAVVEELHKEEKEPTEAMDATGSERIECEGKIVVGV